MVISQTQQPFNNSMCESPFVLMEVSPFHIIIIT